MSAADGVLRRAEGYTTEYIRPTASTQDVNEMWPGSGGSRAGEGRERSRGERKVEESWRSPRGFFCLFF